MTNYIFNWHEYMLYQRGLAISTARSHANRITSFSQFITTSYCRVFEKDLIEGLTLKDFRSWLSYLHGKGASKQVLFAHIVSLRQFYRFLNRVYDLSCSQVLLLKVPKMERPLPKAVDKEYIFKLLDKYESVELGASWESKRDRALLMLLYGCGLRISEALSLKRDQVRGDVVRVRGKGSKEREMPLIDAVRRAIEAYLAICPYAKESNQLFCSKRGSRLHEKAFRRRLDCVQRSLEIPVHITPHTLRHCFATHLLESGCDIMTIKELLGHACVSTTQIYSYVGIQHISQVVNNCHPRV